MNGKEIKNTYSLKNEPILYKVRENAFNSLKTYVKKCYTVILGDQETFWVVSFSDAQRLQKHGYELAI